MHSLRVQDLRKSYDGFHDVFAPLSFELSDKEILALKGRNGAGKSTVMKMLATVLSPSSGTIEMYHNDTLLHRDELRSRLGFVSPYLQLYDEFSLWEHCLLDAQLRGITTPESTLKQLIERFGLTERRNDLLRTYSSGMKQRAKIILALYHSPDVLLLDEPTTNLDDAGIQSLYTIIKEQEYHSGVCIIATNEDRDLAQCSRSLEVCTPSHPLHLAL